MDIEIQKRWRRGCFDAKTKRQARKHATALRADGFPDHIAATKAREFRKAREYGILKSVEEDFFMERF